MFTIIWAAVILMSGAPVGTVTVHEAEQHATRAACQQSIRDHMDRIPDFVRGRINAAWSVEIKVAGSCEAVGAPA